MRFLYIVILFASVNLLSESIYNFQNTEDEIRFNNESYINDYFKNNPGKIEKFIYPTDFKQAKQWFDDFLVNRFDEFGPYEDAVLKEKSILNHSVLSPLLNSGLISPNYVIEKSLHFYEKNNIANEVFSYKPDFFNLIKNSDLCITRSGASALAEIALLGIPFITIPLKNSADDHQKENAKYYEKLDCCWILNQEELNQNKIEELCLMIIENKDEYNKKRDNLKKLNEQNSWKNLNNNLIQFFNDN